MKCIYISAGEHSGDLHAAALAKEIRLRDPDAELIGNGGPLMQQAGVELVADIAAAGTIGFVEAARHIRESRKLLDRVTSVLVERGADVLVWVDYGGFNLALAGRCRQLGIPVVCVFSPSSWAYGQRRAVLMAERVTELAAVLPFEADFYRTFGVRATFVGHPLLDRVKPSAAPSACRTNLGVHERERIVAILPGSRIQEIRRLLPAMLQAVSCLQKDRQDLIAVLPLAPSVPRSVVDEIGAAHPCRLKIVNGGAYDCLSISELALIASGTATLEAAILGTPMVVVYRVSGLSYLIYRLLRNKDQRGRPMSVALPNLVAGRQIVPELLQHQLSVKSLTVEAAGLLDDRGRNQAVRSELEKVRSMLGEPGAMGRTAEIVLRQINTSSIEKRRARRREH